MTPLEILTAVNAFYDQAFNRLLAITFGVIAFIGVLVPIIVGWVQVRSLRQEKNAILNELKSEIETERTNVRDAIEGSVREEMQGLQRKLEERIEQLSNELKTSSSLAEARSFHLQGLTSVRSKKFHIAVSDLVDATIDYIGGKSESNAQRCIALIDEDCLPKINSSQYLEMKIEKKCNKLLKKLREVNENGRYSNHIQSIEREMEKASTRTQKADEQDGA